MRKRRAKATPIQTSFPEPLQQQNQCGDMSNPNAPKEITSAVASVIHGVSPYSCILKRKNASSIIIDMMKHMVQVGKQVEWYSLVGDAYN